MSIASASIAATSTLAMVRAAEARGVDAADLLSGAGLTIEFLQDPDARIPGTVVMGIWNALRERTGDPALQLVAPTSLPYGAYRVIEYLISASATVGDGCRRFAQYFGLIADTISLTVERDGDAHCLQLTMKDGAPVPPVYVDYVFAALVSRVRKWIRPALCVRRVELRRPAPSDPGPYRNTFQSPVSFGARQDRLSFSNEEWLAPTESPDTALVQLMEEHARVLATRVARAAPGFDAALRQAIVAELSRGATAEAVAKELNMSVRTLQRKVVARGTTFRTVAESVKSQLAQGYLSNPGVSITEVTFLLGFSEESAFNRAFRRWTGQAPGRWRRRKR